MHCKAFLLCIDFWQTWQSASAEVRATNECEAAQFEYLCFIDLDLAPLTLANFKICPSFFDLDIVADDCCLFGCSHDDDVEAGRVTPLPPHLSGVDDEDEADEW